MSIITVNVRTGEVNQRPLTEQEVAALPPPQPRDVLAEIDVIERQHLMPRAQREFMLVYMETEAAKAGAAQGLNTEQSIALLRSKNPGYRRVKELDEQINALRELL